MYSENLVALIDDTRTGKSFNFTGENDLRRHTTKIVHPNL